MSALTMSVAGKYLPNDERASDSEEEVEFENADVEEAEDRILEEYARTGQKIGEADLLKLTGKVNPMLLSMSVLEKAADDKTKNDMMLSRIQMNAKNEKLQYNKPSRPVSTIDL